MFHTLFLLKNQKRGTYISYIKKKTLTLYTVEDKIEDVKE